MKIKSIVLVLLISILTSCYSNRVSQRPKQMQNTSMNTVVNPAASTLDLYLEKQHFEGSILVASKNKILLKKGYGFADKIKSVPNEPDTVFRIASLSKAFTAMAIMQLQEQGKLKVSDPISSYLPEIKHGDRITIHHLLAHLSGLPREFESEKWDDPAKRLKEKLATDFQLQHEPGTAFFYSNVGYVILGHLIEKLSGKTYAEYMNEHIFEPLQMKNSYVEAITPSEREGKAIGYENNLFGQSRQVTFFQSDPGPGGISSTVEDLYLWDQALYSEKLVNENSMREIFKDHAPSNGKYGYGWSIEDVNLNIYSHLGYIPGFFSFIKRDVQNHRTVILLSNKGEDSYNLQQESKLTQLIAELIKDT
ncbi:serine hydrolase domain-containing protein [Paenibacillus sp. SI8]|uniref:serine hydrolase domain-containing protein n=1 Tax=unclassified Paenibacillus TaxID=185978 RepID=UPI003467A4CE